MRTELELLSTLAEEVGSLLMVIPKAFIMRFHVLNTYAYLLAGLLSSTVAAAGCSNDNCARAVTGSRRGETFVTSAQADCTSFMVQTITAPGV